MKHSSEKWKWKFNILHNRSLRPFERSLRNLQWDCRHVWEETEVYCHLAVMTAILERLERETGSSVSILYPPERWHSHCNNENIYNAGYSSHLKFKNVEFYVLEKKVNTQGWIVFVEAKPVINRARENTNTRQFSCQIVKWVHAANYQHKHQLTEFYAKQRDCPPKSRIVQKHNTINTTSFHIR